MTATPTDVVHDFYKSLSTGDVPGALGLMDQDIEWITMWHYKIQGRGPGAVADGLFKPLAAEWTSFSFVSSEFVTEGNTVVSLGVFDAVHGGTGKSVNARYAHVWTILDGKITKFRQYIDTLAIAEARQATQVFVTSNERAD